MAKVYGELKRADVKAWANQAQNRQAWGQLKVDQHRWAKEATAAGPIEGLKAVRLGEAQVVCLSKADQLKGVELRRANAD